MEGIVQKFSVLQGAGWIVVGFKTRLFFHVTQWQGDKQPEIGEAVTFDVAPPHKPGQPHNQAVNIMPAGVESGAEGAQ